MKERRLVPRYRYSTEVTICREADNCFAGRTSDVSMSGMGLQLSRDTVVALAEDNNLLTPGDHFDLILSPHVDAVDAVIGPTLLARVRHVRRLSQHEYHVGVLFEALDASQLKALQEIVSEAQAHRTR